MVPRQLGARPDQNRFGPAADFHRIVGDEAMSADDQIERALALADAAVTDDEHAEAEDVHEDGVQDRPLGQ